VRTVTLIRIVLDTGDHDEAVSAADGLVDSGVLHRELDAIDGVLTRSVVVQSVLEEREPGSDPLARRVYDAGFAFLHATSKRSADGMTEIGEVVCLMPEEATEIKGWMIRERLIRERLYFTNVRAANADELRAYILAQSREGSGC
jgi:hypothetical protein